MFISDDEKKAIAEFQTLSPKAKALAVKGWSFFHRFMWPSIAAASLASFALGYCIGR